MSDARAIATLGTLLEHATGERDSAFAASQQAAQQAAQARAQAVQLVEYRSAYEQRWRSQFGQSASIEILRCYTDFSHRLAEAIAQQQRVVAHLDTQAERARELLTEKELRVASVRKLIERRQDELRRAADRRDQKQTDEAAARTLRSRASALD